MWAIRHVHWQWHHWLNSLLCREITISAVLDIITGCVTQTGQVCPLRIEIHHLGQDETRQSSIGDV